MTGEPRIAPLEESARDDEVRELLAKVGRHGPDVHLFTTVVRHRRLFRRWLPLLGGLLSGELPARDRELLILRTALLCDTEYEWAHHEPLASEAGITSDELARVRVGSAAAGWSELDAALLRAAEELHESNTLSDETWSVLSERYSEQQLIEVPMVVGHYHLVAFTLNALQIQLEPDARLVAIGASLIDDIQSASGK